MTVEEKTEIIKRIISKVKAAGLRVNGDHITVEEMLVSPDVAKAIFGEEGVMLNSGLVDAGNEAYVPSWRLHQHQLLDFMQSYNTDEMLRYVDKYL